MPELTLLPAVTREAAAPPASCAVGPGRGHEAQTARLQDLWPPAAIAARMAERERELLHGLADTRALIRVLRRERERLVGQLRALCQPTGCPVGPPEDAWAVAEATASAPQPDTQALVVIPGPPGAPVPDMGDEPELTAAPEPLTPEEELESLVRRLREGDDPARRESAFPQAPLRPRFGPRRLTAAAATAAIIVLSTPTVGHVQSGIAQLDRASGARAAAAVPERPNPTAAPEVSGPVATSRTSPSGDTPE